MKSSPIYPLSVLLEAEARQRGLMEANAAARARIPAEFIVPAPDFPVRLEAAAGLTPMQFLCLSLRYQERASAKEIAFILDVSLTRVFQLESIGLRRLSVESVQVLAKRLAPEMAKRLLARASAVSPLKWRRHGETFA